MARTKVPDVDLREYLSRGHSQADAARHFGTLSTSLTRELTPKLFRELRPAARIVSHQFRLADRSPDRSVTVDGADLYLWTCRHGRCRGYRFPRIQLRRRGRGPLVTDSLCRRGSHRRQVRSGEGFGVSLKMAFWAS